MKFEKHFKNVHDFELSVNHACSCTHTFICQIFDISQKTGYAFFKRVLTELQNKQGFIFSKNHSGPENLKKFNQFHDIF